MLRWKPQEPQEPQSDQAQGMTNDERVAIPAQRTQTVDIPAEIKELGLTVYTPKGFEQFLTTPMEIFDGKTGKQLLKEGQADRVLKELIADYEGLGY